MSKFKIRVSATSANIGAGFDCMGLALDLYNEIIVDDTGDERLKIETDADLPRDETNLIYSSMKAVFDICGVVPNVRIKQINNIPPASGLGSSAACIVLGVVGANLLLNSFLSEQEIVNLCTRLDGHPDNVVPAIKGGVAAGVLTGGGHVEYIKCLAPKNLIIYAATPEFMVHTEQSRSQLPQTYPRADVVYSLSRAIVTFAALVNGDLDKLSVIDDKLHQPYRIPQISGYKEAAAAFKRAGAISTYLSGSGPTVIGFFKETTQISAPDGWTVRQLKIDNKGVRTRKLK